MYETFIQQPKWRGVRFVKGLLKDSPALSLNLDVFDDDLYADDIAGTPIEDLIPDYSILSQIDYKYPVSDAYFTYASRGCVRSCKFCGVPALEGAQRDTYSLETVVNGVTNLYGEKKDLILMDNNVVASPNFKEIIASIVDLGFPRGATIQRGRSSILRRVDFNQGVDARILCKDPVYLRELSKIAIKPLRIAFDHLGLKKSYSQAIVYAAEAGLRDLSNYMLYNFNDSPEDLFERMRLNVRLNEALDIRIFSFPMRYQPVTRQDRGHIGPKWNRYYLRSIQIILQATHGIVSGAPQFFKKAFGDTYDEFSQILLRPHHYIFNRYWYEQFDGRAELDEYSAEMARLSEGERAELLEFLCGCDHWEYESNLKLLSQNVRKVGRFYVPLRREVEAPIWAAQRSRRERDLSAYLVPDDERVEDADLTDEDIGTSHKGHPKPILTKAVA